MQRNYSAYFTPNLLSVPFTYWAIIILSIFTFLSCSGPQEPYLTAKKDSHIILVGNNLCSRMMNFGHFETELYIRYPDSSLIIRNMCDGGNTPGFRPHSGRVSPWAFPEAEKFQTELATNSGSIGHFETPDEWISRLKADIIIGFFGYNESFQGEKGLPTFKAELEAFVDHTLAQTYNGETAPQLALVSPIAFEDLSDQYDRPDGKETNQRLNMYAKAIKEIANQKRVLFLDAFTPSLKWLKGANQLTIDGLQLNDEGYQTFSSFLADGLFGKVGTAPASDHKEMVHKTVMEKNFFWHNDFKIPNGVHVFGRRYDPFGPDNYPAELEKIREMTAIRDRAIWKASQGELMNLAAADAETTILPAVETNYKPKEEGYVPPYRYEEEALKTFTLAPGYEIALFASEKEFPDLANPSQISFDNKGRLWVSVMPSYPHYKPGDPKPDDKLLILEDTDGDFRADKQTVFVDNLHLPLGFEFAPEGVYVSQGTNLKLYTDLDGDDHADKEEIIFSGFDDHDTHHCISAFSADPSGAVYMGEGVFLHTNVETPYGTVRGTNGGFYRFNPQRRHLERTAQISIPNPWGIAFDQWGQPFFAETSGPRVHWMLPSTIEPRYGVANPKAPNLIERDHMVRPTSGLEFVYSRHFPDEVQGDFLINNNIGFLGTKQHILEDKGTGFSSRHRHDLLKSTDPNFRPVDMEFAPDGSLYLVDWHNVLIGHMQHNARDPLRDHAHGRIYRITYPSRPLVTPAKVDEATIETLFENLKLPEYRSRYRSRRELRERDTDEVLAYLTKWIEELDSNDPYYEQYMMEGLWVSWGLNKVVTDLLEKAMEANNYKVRAAATRVIRYMGHQLDNQQELLEKMAQDDHGRVRLEAIIAASWMEGEAGSEVLLAAADKPLDEWMQETYASAYARLTGEMEPAGEEGEELMATVESVPPRLQGADSIAFAMGGKIYAREGYCGTCHQSDGKGLSAAGFPPLAGTQWVLGNEERLIKLALNGLLGPMEIMGTPYEGRVPMTGFRGLLNDDELAAVLTYVRNAFGNEASPISPDLVKQVRAETADKEGYYAPEELLVQYPLQ